MHMWFTIYTNIDLTKVRNICEVWGQVLDSDYYTEDCTYNNNCYICNVGSYDKYKNGDLIAVKIPSGNPGSSRLNINGLGEIQIMDENTEGSILQNTLESGQTYVFKIKTKRIDKNTVTYAYFIGQWQAHGINVLTDGTVSESDHTTQDGKTVKVFSKEYFQSVYNCDSVELNIVPDSPFTVQELGEILDVKQGGDYENITSDSLALARAEYENWKNCRITDSISITTKLCPCFPLVSDIGDAPVLRHEGTSFYRHIRVLQQLCGQFHHLQRTGVSPVFHGW